MLILSFHLSYAAGRHLPARLPQEAYQGQPAPTSAFDNGDVDGYVDGDLYGHLCARADHPDHHVHRDGAPVHGPHPHALAHGTPPKHGTQEEVQFSTRGAGRLTSGCCCCSGDDGVFFFRTFLFVLFFLFFKLCRSGYATRRPEGSSIYMMNTTTTMNIAESWSIGIERLGRGLDFSTLHVV